MSSELDAAGAFVWAAATRLSLSGELLMRRVHALSQIEDVVEPHPILSNIDTIRLLGIGTNGTTSVAVAGAKWNATGSLLLSASVLLPLTDRGLKSGIVPMVSLDYAIAR